MTPFGTEHPLRDTLDREVRARPYSLVNIPEKVSHLAVLSGEHGAELDRRHLAALCEKYDVPPPKVGSNHFIADMGAFRVRWERHTEFSTFTFFRSENIQEPFSYPVINYVPKDWIKAMPGQIMCAVHVEIQESEAPAYNKDDMSRLFEGHSYIGCTLAGGTVQMWTDLRIHEDRFSRILLRDVNLSDLQAGRVVQRLLEIETYRMFALLSLPLAREASPSIRAVDENLARVAAEMSDATQTQTDAELLERLSGLAAEIENVSARNSYRFGATKAYYAIVKSRLADLREERMEGLPTLSEYVERRLAPAMKTCDHTAQRQHALSQRVSRVASLLRARVEVGLEKQNQALLETMNKRAGLQLRLQETVEGLSVVAISYYLIGLLGYGFKGAKALGLPINPDVAISIAVPVVAFLLWSGLRKAKKMLLSSGH